MQQGRPMISQRELRRAEEILNAYIEIVTDFHSRMNRGEPVEKGPRAVPELNGIAVAYERKLKQIVDDGKWEQYIPLVLATIVIICCSIAGWFGSSAARRRVSAYILS